MSETVPERMARRERERQERKAARDKAREAAKQERIEAMQKQMDGARAPKGKLLSEATIVQLLAEIMDRHTDGEIQQAPVAIRLTDEHRILCVGIGKDHHADILIHKDDLEELKKYVVQR